MPTPLQILRILGAAVLALVTLEVSARVDDFFTYDAPLVGYYDIQTLYEFDEAGRRGKPNAQFKKWKLNELGFRGPDLDPGKLTVAVLGASETFGMFESEDLEFPRQLERILQERLGGEVQVANISYAGLSVGQSLIRLDETLQAVRPDWLVVYPSVAAYVDAPKGDWRLSTRYERSRFAALRIEQRIWDLLKEVIPEGLQTAMRQAVTQQAEDSEDIWDSLPEENVQRFQRDLAELVDRTRERGVEVALVTHATRFGDRVNPEEEPFLIAWRKFYPRLAEGGFLDMERRLNDVVRANAAERGLPLIDAAQQMEPGAKNFVEFVHFTDEGARRMAQIIAESIAPLLQEQLRQEPDSAAKQVP